MIFYFKDASNGAKFGLAISAILGLLTKFKWGIKQSAELGNLMTSVERCFEMIKLEPETKIYYGKHTFSTLMYVDISSYNLHIRP